MNDNTEPKLTSNLNYRDVCQEEIDALLIGEQELPPMTVARLKKQIANLPDDMPIYVKGMCDVFLNALEKASVGNVDGAPGLILFPQAEE